MFANLRCRNHLLSEVRIDIGKMTCFTICFGHKSTSIAKSTVDINQEISSVQNSKLYSYEELQTATGNFNQAKKIGEGGFGSVYKGRLNDGSLAAIKVLSAESEQGAKEFLNEIVLITELHHENLVKLYGCCTEGDHRMLVYAYLENNSLTQTLLESNYSKGQFDWETRTKICIGVAQGLAFLHEEVKPHIVHRDIKASNILLDKDFTPKISDFGLAKLFPSTLTHVSTRVAGTRGYLAPEYMVQGKLTRKADIYSFGVLLLEIVSGRCHTDKKLPREQQNLLELAWELYEKGELIQLMDKVLNAYPHVKEILKIFKIGLLCVQDLPKRRPSMSAVVKMLKGETDVDGMEIWEPGRYTVNGSSNAPQMSSDKSLSSKDSSISHATMSFTAIYDRSM